MRRMTLRIYPDWIKGYLDYTANLEAPPRFHVWTALATLAGALRGKCYFDMGHFKWKPNFFVILVAPAGVCNKSTTSGIGMSLLRAVSGINFGPDSVTWQALTQYLSEHGEKLPTGGGNSEIMSCVTLAISELGTFLDMQNREMIDVLVDLWDGRPVPWTRRTKGGGEERILNPWINMIAGTTPAWILQFLPEYAIGGGFTSRCVFVYADKKHKLSAFPRDEMTPDVIAMRDKLIQDLKLISTLNGEITITEGAKEIVKKWYIDHWHTRPAHLRDERLSGYAARKQTHLLKIAMVLSAARRNDLQIDEEIIEAALLLLSDIETNMAQVFQFIGAEDDVKSLAVVLHTLRENGAQGVDENHLYRNLAGRMSYGSYQKAIAAGIFADVIQRQKLGDRLILTPASPPETSRQLPPSPG